MRFLKTLFLSFFVLAVAMPMTYAANTGPENCLYTAPEVEDFSAKLVSVRNKFRVKAGENLEVKVFLMNTGNTPWFSHDSACAGPKMYLGTDKKRDRDSDFFRADSSGWLSANRVKMDQLRVDSGKVASFTFEMHMGDSASAFKEFFTPVIDGKGWLDEAGLAVRFLVGEQEESVADVRTMIRFAASSGDVMGIYDLEGEKKIKANLGTQMMEVYVGDTVVREFKISSGGRKTPTPVGTHKILFKNDVRISGDGAYIMPHFQGLGINGRGFTGFGLHALPSSGSAKLKNEIRRLQAAGEEVPASLYEDNAFWTEALDHLGRPVSHGCIRMSPEDAKFVFDFLEIGTVVEVSR